jgi:hypothetical protein
MNITPFINYLSSAKNSNISTTTVFQRAYFGVFFNNSGFRLEKNRFAKRITYIHPYNWLLGWVPRNRVTDTQ